mgnify:CR=1 FL=1
MHLGRSDVVVPNLPGFGRTALPNGQPDLAAVATSLWEHVPPAEPVVLVGISLGGYVALAMARQRPVAGLGLVDTKLSADTPGSLRNRQRLADQMDRRESMAYYAKQALPTLLGATTHTRRASVVSQVRSWIEQADPRSVAWYARAMGARPDSTDVVENFDGPVLAMRGDEDSISTVEDVAAVAALARRCTVVTVPGCGHLPPIEDAAGTASALDEWLTTYW